ncbi:hypothetical protein T492DRAFT_948290 [Pavlovales sp. CCMP2436]|nr:hypothetical protein T492DRAFT_948290 [Pavlovales sp. CCMP2436]|mmetsp:Transcript_33689/g.83951  ORF Transcript_33689/g.83951 Transcript_33689/m.83951 type:complete len:378 (+) Transcript_33689:59-1192(+)
MADFPPPAVRVSQAAIELEQLEALNDMDSEALRELFKELMPDGTLLPETDAVGLRVHIARQISNEGAGLGDLSELLDNAVGLHGLSEMLGPPPIDRSASLARCTDAVEPSRLRLELTFENHGHDDDDQVVIKGRKIDVDVIVTTDSDQLAVRQQLQLEVAIVYDNGLPVDELANSADEPLMQVLGTRQPWLLEGKAKFEVKINVLSSMRNMQKFRILVIPADPATRAAYPGLKCLTAPIKTLSKMPRRKALGTDAASRAAKRLDEQRRHDEVQLLSLASRLGASPDTLAAAAPVGAAGGAVDGGGQAEALRQSVGEEALGVDRETSELRSKVEMQERHIQQLMEVNKTILEELTRMRLATAKPTEVVAEADAKRTRE